MGKTLPGVLMFLLVILKVLGAAEADCSCSSSTCDCSSLGLTSVPQNLPTNITYLDLGSNQIATLSQSDFSRYRNLETLRLKNNSISTINDQAFYYLSHLVTLYIYLNSLTSIGSDMFTGLENLQYLYLHGNNITDIEAGTFNRTQQLRYLSINNNKLRILRSDMFTGLGHLESLLLYDNMINNIQVGTFDLLPQLRILSLRNNNITMFPFEDLTRNQLIDRLDLDNNQLTTLSSKAYDTLSSIYNVTIESNPWVCDCKIADFRLKMTGYRSFENQVTCSQPDHLSGQKLKDIDPKNLSSGCLEPKIIRFERSDNITLHEWDTLHLVCEASGIPTPVITVILPSGLNATVGSYGGEATVDVNGSIIVRYAEAGRYACIAASLAGSTTDQLVVDLLARPTVHGSLDLSLPVLVLTICGSIAGTLFIVAITIWCKRGNNNSPLERPDNSVVFNNCNTTVVITRFHSRKEQTRPRDSSPNPSVAPMPAEYETGKPCHEKPRPRSADPMVAFGRTNESNDERPPLPLPRTTDTDDSLHQYQSLRKTDTESVDDYETPHDYVTLP
ncbi:leucine-rich repeat-containing protein 24-like [Branchiostoma lanceolatum]|uniref:leucine-rich repeat-containing protein 24-like n=1 Tax=Branchiostoma lanceolatum TaxID=7740 RepID=UPI0034515ACF